MKRLPKVSIVVCCYNGADVLPACLTALHAQKYNGALELIVVDDGSADETYKVATSFKGVKVVRNKPNKGLAGARNVGVAAASGEIIAFTDDDCRPQPTWVARLVAGYTGDDVLAVGGDVISNDTSTVVLRYLDESKPLKPLENNLAASTKLTYRFGLYAKGLLGLAKKPANRTRRVYSLVGANMSFRKQALQDAGLFDDKFRFGAEEEDVCKRIRAAHPNGLVFTPKAKVMHQFEPGLRDTLRRSRAYGLGNARMFRKHVDVTPIIYPFPILIALLILLGVINPWLALAPLVVVPFVYARWLLLAIKRRRPEPVLYAYIQCLQEAYGNAGFIKGAWQYRHMFSTGTVHSAAGHLSLDFVGRKNTWGPAALVVVALLLTGPLHLTWLHVPLAIAMLLVPGYLVLRLIGFTETSRPALRLAVAAISGIAWTMAIGLFAAAVLPLFGIKQPLHTTPLVGVYAGGLALLTLLALRLPEPVTTWKFKATNRLSVMLYAVAVLLPVLSFVGASLLNNGRSNIVLIIMFLLAGAAAMIAIVRSKDVSPSVLPALLFSISLSAVWTYSLRSASVFGWDIQQEYGAYLATHAAAAWHVGQTQEAYSAMLSLTTFPTTLANLSGVSGAVIFKALFPILFSTLPVVLYYAYRQFAKRWIAFTAAALTIAQFAYLQEFSALVRQQVAFLFFAILVYALLNKTWAVRTKRWLVGMSIAGMVVSHYSTTYAAIALFVGAYVVAKFIHFFLQHDTTVKQIVRREAFLRMWVIAALIGAAIVWYGPVTHSNTIADSVLRPSAYGRAIDRADEFLHHNVVLSLQHSTAPVTTQTYLGTIGQDYGDNKQYMKYYFGASNAGLEQRTTPQIGHDRLLFPASQLADTVLRYGWWILAMGGTVALLWGVYRKFSLWSLELSVLAAAAPVLFILGHLVPQVAKFYNITRMNEHMLLLAALPAVATAAWLLERYLRQFSKLVIATALCASFLIAAGLATQLAGGTPTANLNNFGSDYQRFYPTDTDTAAAQWLAAARKPGDVVYADRYATLRLTPFIDVKQGFFRDVTPETISLNAYVYADHANIADDTAAASFEGKAVLYQFPRYFLATHKNLLYSNGQAEIYR